MPRSRLSLEFTEAIPESNPAVKSRQRDAPASQPLKKHAGRELRDGKTSFQLRGLANELCQHRLVARSQQPRERDGRRLCSKRRRHKLYQLLSSVRGGCRAKQI